MKRGEEMENREYEREKRNRYAYEWYVNEQDAWYWKRTVRQLKKTTALAATSAVVSGIAIATSLLVLLRK